MTSHNQVRSNLPHQKQELAEEELNTVAGGGIPGTPSFDMYAEELERGKELLDQKYREIFEPRFYTGANEEPNNQVSN